MKPLKREIWLGALALAVAVALAARDPLVLVELREGVFDAYQRVSPRPAQAPRVKIIDIDEPSIARIGQWPWPRSRLADLVDRLREAGAVVVVFDILFAEPDRTSPARILAPFTSLPDVARIADQLPDFDAEFAAAVGRSTSVTGFALSPDQNAGGGPPVARPAGFAFVGGDPAPFLLRFPSAVASLPAIQAAAAGNGALNVSLSAGGVIRRAPLLFAVGEEVYPSLAAEALRVSLGADTYLVKIAGGGGEWSFGAETGITHVRIGPHVVPTDARGAVWIHFAPPRPERFIPAWRVLEPGDGVNLRGAIVLIGSTALGLQDLHATPIAAVYPGVAIHAEVIEQVLEGAHLTRPDWAKGAEILLMLSLAALVLRLSPRIGAGWTAAIGALAAAGAVGASWYAFDHHGVLLDPVFPTAVVFCAYGAVSLIGRLRAEQEQRWVKKAFASYVSPKLVKQLIDDPDGLKLSGERRELSFLFTDLAGFTTLVEQNEPTIVVPIINEYLDGMIRIAFRHDGAVDKIVGDALHVMFGAPVADARHADRAVACALEIDSFAQAFAEAQRARGVAFGETRIGVNSGNAIVGNFGGELRFDYTAHGDAINTAARLESANRHLGTRICVSDATRSHCSHFCGRPVAILLLKGKQVPTKAWEPLPGATDAAYERAFGLIEASDPAALAAFEALVRERPDDRLVAAHLARLRAGATGALITLAEK